MPLGVGSAMPGGSLTSLRWDSSERRRSKDGRNALCHAVRRSPAPEDAADGGLRFSFPNVAFHVSRREDWRAFPSLLLRQGEDAQASKSRRMQLGEKTGRTVVVQEKIDTIPDTQLALG